MNRPSVHSLPGGGRSDRRVIPARLLDISEAAQVLNVPENWLRKKVSARAVPFTRIGRHVRFTTAHLEQIIAGGEQAAVAIVSADGPSRRARRAS